MKQNSQLGRLRVKLRSYKESPPHTSAAHHSPPNSGQDGPSSPWEMIHLAQSGKQKGPGTGSLAR